jgi:hypothetical protein
MTTGIENRYHRQRMLVEFISAWLVKLNLQNSLREGEEEIAVDLELQNNTLNSLLYSLHARCTMRHEP